MAPINRKFRLFRLCLRVWRAMEGTALGKRKEQVEKIEDFERGGLWVGSFTS